MLNQNWSSNVSHDSLDNIELIGWNELSVYNSWIFSMHNLLELIDSIAQKLLCKTETNTTFLEVIDGEGLQLSIRVTIFKAIELVVMVVIDHFAATMVDVLAGSALLSSHTGLKVKEINFRGCLDHQKLTISRKRRGLHEIN